MQKKGKKRNSLGIKHIIVNYISENINIYLKIFMIFLIGICIGTVIINQLPEAGLQNINDYINNSIHSLKDDIEIPKLQILKSSVFKNIVIVFFIWILGLMMVGSFPLYFLTLIIGMTFGYTLSAIIVSFTLIQGILFFVTSMLLPNIINIPSIIFLIVECIKSHKSLAFKKNYSLKYVVAKHSACSIGVMLILFGASLIESYICSKLLCLVLPYL